MAEFSAIVSEVAWALTGVADQYKAFEAAITLRVTTINLRKAAPDLSLWPIDDASTKSAPRIEFPKKAEPKKTNFVCQNSV